MRYLSGNSNLRELFLAALAAGIWSVPAVAAHSPQASTTTTHKQTTHKTTNGTASHSAAHSAAKNSTSATTPSATNLTTAKPTGATAKKSVHSKASSHSKGKRVKGQGAPTAERINEIQEALASKGAFADKPTGKWDDSTTDAMKKFQASHGLDPTGKLDALTLQKLGLGSQTAGLAAPIAPPNSTNRLRSSSSLPEEPRPEEPRN